MARKKTNTKTKKRKFHIKKGDRVVVLSGRDKGETGEVLEMLPNVEKAIVDQINMVKKHQKPQNDDPGGIIEIPAPIHVSNLMLLDPSTGEPTKVGRRREGDKLVRYSKKTDQTID